MSKKKSMVLLILITIVLVVVGAMSVISFPVPGTVKNYNSILSIIDLGSDLGGGFYAVYYPEGVISAEDYQSEYESLPEENRADYAAKYVAHGGIYVEKNLVDDDFIEDFNASFEIIAERFKTLELAGLTVGVQDDYTIRVQIPKTVSEADTILTNLVYTGEFNLTHSSSTKPLLQATRYHAIDEYFTKAGMRKAADGTVYISLGLTQLGREEFAEISETVASDTDDQVLEFNVGENSVLSLTVSGILDTKTLYISGGESEESAKTIVALLNSCIKGNVLEMELTKSDTLTYESTLGKSVTTLLLIGMGVAVLAMAIYSIARYRGLGAVHLYAFVTFTLALILALALISGMAITLGSMLAVVFSAGLMVATNYIIFENVRAEFATGKTLAASIKSAYKKCLFPVIEQHALVFIGALLTYFIAITEAHTFGLILALGTVFSAVATLLVTRFYWHIMMNQAKNQFKFCGFKREVEEDD